MMRRVSWLLSSISFVVCAVVVASACSGDGNDGGDDLAADIPGGEDTPGEVADGQPQQCLSGITWAGGDEDSPLMKPGVSCMLCHGTNGEEPFAVAGTVYGAFEQPDDCYGVPGITVKLTGSDGTTVMELVSNASGNFFLKSEKAGSLTPPFSVELSSEDGTRAMLGPAPSGDCNSCHTSAPMNGTPGRILAP